MIRLARAAMANIRQNVAIALGLKGVFLVTTILWITGLWIAILADTGATVLARYPRHATGIRDQLRRDSGYCPRRSDP